MERAKTYVPLAVEAISGKGRGIIVKSAVKKGTLLLSEHPYASAPITSCLSTVCHLCFTHDPPSQCAKCHRVRYCDANCQRADWTEHKGECRTFAKVEERRKVDPRVGTAPAAVRVLARAWLRGQKEPKGWKAIEALESHVEQFRSSARFPEFGVMSRVLRDCILASGSTSCPREDEMMTLFCQLSTNSFSIYQPDLTDVGVGIYPALSLLNHSCWPNAVVTFEGNIGRVWTIRDLIAGEEILYSYIDTVPTTMDRQRELRSRYHFSCACSLCKGQLADFRSSWRCRAQEGCDGSVSDPTGTSASSAESVTTSCSKDHRQAPLSITDVQPLQTQFESSIATLAKANTSYLAESTPSHLASLQSSYSAASRLVVSFADQYLHLGNSAAAEAHRHLAEAALTLANAVDPDDDEFRQLVSPGGPPPAHPGLNWFRDAFVHSKWLVRAHAFLLPENHPARAVRNLVAARLASFLDGEGDTESLLAPGEALDLYTSGLEMVEVAYGRESSFWLQVEARVEEERTALGGEKKNGGVHQGSRFEELEGPDVD